MKILLEFLALVIMAMITYWSYVTNTPMIACYAFGGFIAGVVWMWSFLFDSRDKINAYKKQLEKTNISSDESSSKVDVLEAKIATLEKALENALKK